MFLKYQYLLLISISSLLIGKPTSTVSLARLVLQSFIGVETSLNRYKKLDGVARDLKLRILTERAIFLSGIELLLFGSGAKGADVSRALSKSGVIKSIQDQYLLRTKLGRHYNLVQNSILDAQIALEGIMKVLEVLAMDTKRRDRVSGVLHTIVAESGIASILWSCWGNFMAMLLPRGYAKFRTQSNVEAENLTPEKLRLSRGPQELKLKELLSKLEENIASLDEALQLALKPSQLSSNHLRSSTTSSPSALAPPRNPENPKFNRIILDHLYHMISREFDCRCHFIHLCVCNASVAPGPICSLFATLNLNAPGDRYRTENPVHLTVLRPRSGNINAMPSALMPALSHAEHSPSCSKILTSPIGSSHHLAHPYPTRIEFLLRHTYPPACPPNPGTLSNPLRPIITLHELLESHPRGKSTVKLEERDRFLLAAKLAQWVFQHYGTPWLRNLDVREIRFFTRYESDLTQNCANWTPYISVTFNGPSDERTQHNKGLYDLGFVLLELGLGKPLVYGPGNKADAARAASRKLSASLGRWYKDVVEKLLFEAGSGYSIEEKQINDLGNKIKFMEERALKIFPE